MLDSSSDEDDDVKALLSARSAAAVTAARLASLPAVPAPVPVPVAVTAPAPVPAPVASAAPVAPVAPAPVVVTAAPAPCQVLDLPCLTFGSHTDCLSSCSVVPSFHGRPLLFAVAPVQALLQSALQENGCSLEVVDPGFLDEDLLDV